MSALPPGRRLPDRPAHGKHKAAELAPDRVKEALREFRRLNTPEARAAFADYWIGIWAKDFSYAWPMLYELLRVVKDERLYADPLRVGPAAPGGPENHGDAGTYASFEDYFRDTAGLRWSLTPDGALQQVPDELPPGAPQIATRALGKAVTLTF